MGGSKSMSTRQEVYAAINTERDYQDGQRDNGRFTEQVLPVSGELLCIQEYLNKANLAYVVNPGEVPLDTLHAIRKVAAMCVRTLEHYGAVSRVVSQISDPETFG
jgi:hypothetical protein